MNKLILTKQKPSQLVTCKKEITRIVKILIITFFWLVPDGMFTQVTTELSILI